SILVLAMRGGAQLVPRYATAAVAILVAAGLAWMVTPPPPVLVGYGRTAIAQMAFKDTFVYVGEGRNASLAVSKASDGSLLYHNAGKVQASSLPQDARLQRMLGHLTTLLPVGPKNVLVIACGAGVTAGAVSIDPRVERETIVELEGLVPRVASTFFHEHNFN